LDNATKEYAVTSNDQKSNNSKAALQQAHASHLMAKLEAALRTGALKPVNPNSQPAQMPIRGKTD